MRAPFDREALVEGFERLERYAREDADRAGMRWDTLKVARSADLKYALQVYDVEAEVPGGAFPTDIGTQVVDNFERAYARRYGEGVGYPEGGIDLTALRIHVEPSGRAAGQSPLERGFGRVA